MRVQLLLLDQALKRFDNQLFAFTDIVENFVAQNEKTAIHPEVAVTNATKLRDETVIYTVLPTLPEQE